MGAPLACAEGWKVMNELRSENYELRSKNCEVILRAK